MSRAFITGITRKNLQDSIKSGSIVPFSDVCPDVNGFNIEADYSPDTSEVFPDKVLLYRGVAIIGGEVSTATQEILYHNRQLSWHAPALTTIGSGLHSFRDIIDRGLINVPEDIYEPSGGDVKPHHIGDLFYLLCDRPTKKQPRAFQLRVIYLTKRLDIRGLCKKGVSRWESLYKVQNPGSGLSQPSHALAPYLHNHPEFFTLPPPPPKPPDSGAG